MKPRHLPKIRHQILKHLTDPKAPIRTLTGEGNQAGLDELTDRVRNAMLYWASPDMTALAVSAGDQLAAARWMMADRPSSCGLIVYSGGLSQIDYQGVAIPVDALSWGTTDGVLSLDLWIDRAHLIEGARALGADLVVEGVPPLMPIRNVFLPIDAQPTPFAELADIPTVIVQALAASWLLMQQPKLIDRQTLPGDKQTTATAARLGYADPDVTLVDLRRAYVPNTRDEQGEEGGRRYRHRWVVSGHWRDQAHGPDRSQRRKTWIESHTKGPDGAPLLLTERVNVWRR